MLRILSLLIVITASPVALSQSGEPSLSPDGEAYSPAGEQENYRWFANTLPVDYADEIILRDGQVSWAVTEADACRVACDAFLGCHAFLYFEPRLYNEQPRCQLLKSAPDPTVSDGVHLYLPK